MLNDSQLPPWLIMHHPSIHSAILTVLFGLLLIVVGAVLTPPRGRGYLVVALTMLLAGVAGVLLIA